MSLSTQFYTMIAMISMGGWLGAALDTYGRFLKRPKRAHWVVFINDILFWLMQGLIIFYILLMVNQGELRFYVFVALLCGYAAYQSLVRSSYLKLLELMIKIALSFFRFLARTCHLLVIRPFQLLIQAVLLLFGFLLKIVGFILQFLLNLIKAIGKIILSILALPGKLIWRITPKGAKNIVRKFTEKAEGFFLKVKNISSRLLNWWRRFRKR